jgi:hypothetical protein
VVAPAQAKQVASDRGLSPLWLRPPRHAGQVPRVRGGGPSTVTMTSRGGIGTRIGLLRRGSWGPLRGFASAAPSGRGFSTEHTETQRAQRRAKTGQLSSVFPFSLLFFLLLCALCVSVSSVLNSSAEKRFACETA